MLKLKIYLHSEIMKQNLKNILEVEILVEFFGPSGVGKSTLGDLLIKRENFIKFRNSSFKTFDQPKEKNDSSFE